MSKKQQKIQYPEYTLAHFLSKEDKDKFSEIAHGINVKKKAIVQKKVGNNEITKNIKINSINEKIEKSKFCSNENKPTIKKVNSENKIVNNNIFQKNILELNNKCLKYSSLSQKNNLKKYKEENKRNLRE